MIFLLALTGCTPSPPQSARDQPAASATSHGIRDADLRPFRHCDALVHRLHHPATPSASATLPPDADETKAPQAGDRVISSTDHP